VSAPEKARITRAAARAREGLKVLRVRLAPGERRTPLALVEVRLGPVVVVFGYARLRRQRWQVKIPQDAAGGRALRLSPALERRVMEMVREAVEACPKVSAALRPICARNVWPPSP
jgi:hypothetical protein